MDFKKIIIGIIALIAVGAIVVGVKSQFSQKIINKIEEIVL